MTSRAAFTGFVLAGGASRRLGTRKEHLFIQGETLLERQTRLLRKVCKTVAIVGPPFEPSQADTAIIQDLTPACGPLGGIYAALCFTRTDFNLIVGCDLPRLDRRFLDFLCRQTIRSGAPLTVPMSGRGRFEPLCAVYRRDLRWVIGSRLREGMKKTSGFYRHIALRRISLAELTAAGFKVSLFDNMNTWEDYERITGKLGADHRRLRAD
jgi:molybdenum cofactor guanylyltransferase